MADEPPAIDLALRVLRTGVSETRLRDMVQRLVDRLDEAERRADAAERRVVAAAASETVH